MLLVIFVLVCDVSVVCTCTVLLHILSGSVRVCNLWSARLWECNAHDWLEGCVVGQNRFHLHVSPMMSHAHSSSSSCLHMSVLPLSSHSSTSSTPQTTLPINKHFDYPQTEECCPVANTTSSKGYEPNLLDNFGYSETSATIFQNESGDLDTEPSYSFDAELDDELVRKALSSQLVTQ